MRFAARGSLRPLSWPLALLPVFLSGSCGSDDAPSLEGLLGATPAALSDEVMKENGETLVYESVHHHDPASQPILVSQLGSIDNSLFQRYARPFAFRHEATRYQLIGWEKPLASGGVERVVRVTSRETGPAMPASTVSATMLDPELVAMASDAQPGSQELVRVQVRLRDYPDWDIPIVPHASLVSASELAIAIGEREAAIDARKFLIEEASQDLEAAAASLGGVITQKIWSVGWVEVELPLWAAPSLASHPDVRAVLLGKSAGGTGAGREDLRPVEQLGIAPYWSNGQVGDEPNPSHGYGAIVVATIDRGPIKDEARGFCVDANCASTKFVARFRCDQPGPNYCIATSNYPTALENLLVPATNHHTRVAGTVVADYFDSQGVGYSDPGGAGSLAWRKAASSDAYEAKLLTFGALRGTWGYGGVANDDTYSYADALVWSTVLDADIITSGTWTGTTHTLTAFAPHEQAAENAFDDGAFLVILPGNNAGPSSPSFNVSSPASVPKVFTVNDLAWGNNCESDYKTCQLDTTMSSRGGATATIGAVNYPNAVSVIDLAVPQNVSHGTTCAASDFASECVPYGTVTATGGDSGTSFANPRLAGIAAVAKDYFLATSQPWIDAPGFLHTYMLSQGDSHRSSSPESPGVPTGLAVKEADKFYGMGRVKMKHPYEFGF